MTALQLIVEDLCFSYPIFGTHTLSMRNRLVTGLAGKLISQARRDASRVVSVNALQNVSFSLRANDRLGLIGQNGAGKSSLLRVLSGIYKPTSGKVRIEGPVRALLNIGNGVDLDATGRENILALGLLAGVPRIDLQNLVEDVAEFSELGHFLELPICTYSSGMMMRLFFGVATYGQSGLLLLDEVIGVGDASFMVKAEARMDTMLEGTRAVVLASHSSELIRRYCNKVLWLEHGVVKAFGGLELLEEYEEASVAGRSAGKIPGEVTVSEDLQLKLWSVAEIIRHGLAAEETTGLVEDVTALIHEYLGRHKVEYLLSQQREYTEELRKKVLNLAQSNENRAAQLLDLGQFLEQNEVRSTLKERIPKELMGAVWEAAVIAARHRSERVSSLIHWYLGKSVVARFIQAKAEQQKIEEPLATVALKIIEAPDEGTRRTALRTLHEILSSNANKKALEGDFERDESDAMKDRTNQVIVDPVA